VIPALETALAEMPNSVDAEQAVLGACLISRSAIDRVRLMLRSQDFYVPAHVRIFAAMEVLADSGKPVDTLSLTEELRTRGQLAGIGGIAYILTLNESVPTAAHAEYYAETVQKKATRRGLIEAAGAIAALGRDGGQEEDDICEQAEQLVYAARRKSRGTQFVPTGTMGEAMLARFTSPAPEQVPYPTGLRGLDFHLHGWQPGSFNVIVGDSGMGKTQFLCFTALAAAAAGVPVAIFSLEMPKEEIYTRMTAMLSGVDSARLLQGRVRPFELEPVCRAIGQLDSLGIEINDGRDGRGVLEVRSQAREWMRRRDRGLILLDHLHEMDHPPRMDNPVQAVTHNAKGLKSMARELGIPVAALAQVNRGPDKRENHRPRKGDIRDSQMVVAEADVILGLYREGFYQCREASEESPEMVREDWPAEAEIIGLKHRGGQEFSRKVWFDGPTGNFYEQDPRHDTEGGRG